MEREAPLGSSTLYIVEGVAFLHEDASVFEAMLDGWSAQMIGGRRLQVATVNGRVKAVRRFQGNSGTWPWEWSAAGFDEWMTDLMSVQGIAPSTLRGYQNTIKQFCDFLCSPHYGWVAECEKRFGTHPVQVCHEWNTRPHLQEHEGDPRRRPLTRAELQLLFDRADAEVDARLSVGRKGAAAAYRDATLLRVVYAWGLRAREAIMLDVTDFHRNPKLPELAEFGFARVRYGKGSRGAPPKPRTVASVMPWAVAALGDYVENVLPLMRTPGSAALWSRNDHDGWECGRSVTGSRCTETTLAWTGLCRRTVCGTASLRALDRSRSRPGVRATPARACLPIDDRDLHARVGGLRQRDAARGTRSGAAVR